MNDSDGYAVFFFPPALEVLGEAIKPYLQDGPAGPHVPCREVDTGGAFIEMTLEGSTSEGRVVEMELMVPTNMVRMIVSARSDQEFGFQRRRKPFTVLLETELAPVSEAAPPDAIEATTPAAGTEKPAA